MERLKKLKQAAGIDTKILAVGAVLVLAALFVVFGGLPTSSPSSGGSGEVSQPRTTTTMYQPATTTTLAEEIGEETEVAEETEEGVAEVTGDDCSSICLAAEYSSGQCRPGCLSYEDRPETNGSDCLDIQKCCCK